MKHAPLAGLCLALLAPAAMALDASSVKLSVYSVMLSTSPLCSSPVTVFSNPTPVDVDFLSGPTLGKGNPADGTYNCVIIKMKDLIRFKPSGSAGSCVAGNEYTIDVCRSENSGTSGAPDSTGAPTACTGTDSAPAADTVYLYLTTNSSAGSVGNTFSQPTSTASGNGLNLTAPLVISGNAKSKFVVNATGKVDGAHGPCGMEPPIFGFEKL